MRRRGDRIPLDSLPTRFDKMAQVKLWHVRRVVADSETWGEAAFRLGMTRKTLWEYRKRTGFKELPHSDASRQWAERRDA